VSDTCFIHATNMYFQRKYIDDQFLKKYVNFVKTYQVDADQIKYKEAKRSFYGDQIPPSNGKTEEISDPAIDDDLLGYFELYSTMNSKNMADSILDAKCKELSAFQILFILEFQIQEIEGEEHLVYVPHRFFHRYSRSKDQADQLMGKKLFLDQTEKADQIYLGRIENKKSHATCMLKINENWILMDSLKGNPLPMPQKDEIFNDIKLCSSASILMTRDFSRDAVLLSK